MTFLTRRALIHTLVVVVMLTGVAQAQETTEETEAVVTIEGEAWIDDPRQIMVWVELPRTVSEGDTVELRVTIENARTDGPFRLSSIDFDTGLVAGFEVLEMSPRPRHQQLDLTYWIFEHPLDIPAGQTREFCFQLRANKAGIYIGDVDVYEGGTFLTRAAQIRVR